MIHSRKLFGLLTTSASIERAFWVLRSITSDYWMAMSQKTIFARLMVQAKLKRHHAAVGKCPQCRRISMERSELGASGSTRKIEAMGRGRDVEETRIPSLSGQMELTLKLFGRPIGWVASDIRREQKATSSEMRKQSELDR
jgi:hypothetical protein